MSKLTIMPTSFDQADSASQYFKNLSLDAKKFPEKYRNAIVVHAAEDMEELVYHCLNDLNIIEFVGMLEATKFRALENG